MPYETVLYDYWRSSASYRVRIALNSLGIEYLTVPVNLLDGEHKATTHLRRNPQGLVPALEIDGLMMTQSLAIMEYLAETRVGSGLLPGDAPGRQRVRALAYAIAMDVHPICNLGVVGHVMELTAGDEAARVAWMRKFIGEGLLAVERMLDDPRTGLFCHGDSPTMAEMCLVPQVYNAERWGVDLSALCHVRRVVALCNEQSAFRAAHPDRAKLQSA
ncbi:maleylacetoacetate isomerase [Rhizobium subbaraonis]|uniref:Maleylacetoacetate isomerase n=1 Tax=Rhizobium subbaraonis TaxID=908946 RepID=A0A285U1Y8_9HYPH|nr:maleylacetoacetate isomerase [Rhizobium subbaraonis]SOC35839.1 maleylacetoacetate isomerase [Rhizobium subbaraonis]